MSRLRYDVPFTLSHPAAVLALRRTGLPIAAMAVGSMAPDAPLFAPIGFGGYGFTHSLRGVITLDLALTAVGVVLWFGLLRDPLVDIAPGFVRERLPATARYTKRQWALVPVAAVIGSFTHVAWDSFTHQNRWGESRITWLQTDHLGWPGYRWAQAVSSVVGLMTVTAWAAVEVRRRPRHVRGPRRPKFPGWALPAILAIILCACVASALAQSPRGPHGIAYTLAVTGVISIVVTITVVSLAWHALDHPLAGGPSV